MRNMSWLAVWVIGLGYHCLLLASPIEVASNRLPLSAVPKEVERWEQLMQVTQRNLEIQKQIYRLLLTYQNLQKQESPSQSADELYERAQVARELQVLIQDYRLEALFSKEFLQELQLFGEVGSKRGIPQP